MKTMWRSRDGREYVVDEDIRGGAWGLYEERQLGRDWGAQILVGAVPMSPTKDEAVGLAQEYARSRGWEEI